MLSQGRVICVGVPTKGLKTSIYTLPLHFGKVITGLILEESGDAIKVIENPLVKADPVIIKRSDVDERVKSPTSIMPKGLLDKLTREEILDLVAYVSARGDKKAKVFNGGGGHEHHHH